MRHRAEPLPPRTGPRYFRARVGERPETITFRVPARRTATEAVNALAEAHRASVLEAVEAARGALIRACWADEAVELEAGDGPGVHAELWDAGWSGLEIAALAVGLAQEVGDRFLTEAKVAGKVDFFSSAESGSATRSVSVSPTSATPGDFAT